MREFSASAALNSILPGQDAPTKEALDAMRQLYDAVGPEMPDDLKATAVKSSLPSGKVKKFNYDEGHAGRMSVPGTDGGSIDFKWVLKQSDVAKFIVKYLAFRDAEGDTTGYSDDEELVVFVPGLNTLHEPAEGETTTVERLKHYVKVLGFPMSQLHIGTSFDQGDVHIDASRAPSLRALISSGSFLPRSVQPETEDGNELTWNSRQIDRIQVGLSQYNAIEMPIKQSLQGLLDTTKDRAGPQIVLMVYSRGATECEAALRKHVEESRERQDAIFRRLRERVTVVTVGCASHDFPDGPAYIHLAAWTDPLSTVSGMTAKHNADGAGKDALFLNCDSPYSKEAFDNHNFGAVTSQYLAIVMAASGAKKIRELWEMGQRGEMAEPGEEVLRAMIQATRGWEWLWSVEEAWQGIPMGALPDTPSAIALLREEFGDKFVQRILTNFGTN